MQQPSRVLPFPAENTAPKLTALPAALPEPETPQPDGYPRRNYVRTEPVVGNHGVHLTYIDEDWVPRMEFKADLTVSEETLEMMRRMLQAFGERLPPLPGSSSTSLLRRRPRLRG